MLATIGTLGGLLKAKSDHPLADPRELRRILAEIPTDNGFRALDEVAGWLESLLAAENFPTDRLFEAVRQLDDAAQPHLRRLTRDYLQAARMSRAEEKRLWSIVHGVWQRLAAGYELCLSGATAGKKLPDGLKPSLSLLCARLIAALGAVNKWDSFHYGPLTPSLWVRLGHACLTAETAGVARRPLQLYPQMSGATTVEQEYLKAMVFRAASMDCLLPLEIELAERLIAHFLPKFVFGPEAREDSVYWVDLAKDLPPTRLARMPGEISPGLRFFQPGPAHADLTTLALAMEKGSDLPPALNLGGQYPARTVLPVLRHLAAYLAPIPPQRRHRRHRVKHRMAVVGGLADVTAVFAGETGNETAGLQPESWVVEDVSLGGFGSVMDGASADSLKIGALLALQPEGGDNWLLGIIRRCHREAGGSVRVGIESLCRQVASVELKPRTVTSYASSATVSALWLQDGDEGSEWRLVLPPASFDLRESMELRHQGQRILLTPLALLEQTTDYELARYRALTAE